MVVTYVQLPESSRNQDQMSSDRAEDRPFRTPVSAKLPKQATNKVLEQWARDQQWLIDRQWSTDGLAASNRNGHKISQNPIGERLRTTEQPNATPTESSQPMKTELFATPRNDDFYSRHSYSQLNVLYPEIRLLKLHKTRLSLEEAADCFPTWSSSVKSYDTPPRIVDPGQVAQPVFDMQLARERPHDKYSKLGEFTFTTCVSVGSPPEGFHYVRNVPDPVELKVPYGWGIARGLTPYFRTVQYPESNESFWSNALYSDYFDGSCGVGFMPLEHAWYFVNMYNGEATWKLPGQKAPGSPDLYPNRLICCEIVDKVPLTGIAGNYTAVSYCAGSPQSTTEILVDGVLFNAFANLEHALECIRSSSAAENTDAPILIWTDQVCINQSNAEERSSQVSIMREIYEQADHVNVVLSTSSTPYEVLQRARVGSEALRQLAPASRIQNGLQTVADEDGVEELLTHLRAIPDANVAIARLESCCGLIEQVLTASWWTRAWVFQEFVVAARAYVFFGSLVRVPWPEIMPWLSLFGPKAQELLSFWAQRNEPAFNGSYNNSLSYFYGSHTHSRDSEGTVISFGSVSAVRKRAKAMDHVQQRAMHFIRSKNTFDGCMNWYQLLLEAWRFAATDARDKVFALTGLADPRYAITADYHTSNTVVRVMVEATEMVIRAENSLPFLNQVVLRSRVHYAVRMPTWAPDWTCGASPQPELADASGFTEGKVQQIQEPASQTEYVAAVRWDRELPTLARLELRGLLVGTLRQRRERLASYEWWQRFDLVIDGATEFPQLVVTTSSHARPRDELWVLDGAAGFWVLRPQPSLDRWLVFCAGLHEPSRNKLAERHTQSRTLYEAIAKDGECGRREARTILLIQILIGIQEI